MSYSSATNASSTVLNNSDHAIKGLPEACVYVSSLSQNTTEENLHKYFEQFFGKVLKTTITRKENRTFGFVQFQEVSSAKASVASTDTHILDGSRIRVERARVNSTLFLGRISKSLTNSDLRALCENYGQVESVTVIKERGTQDSRGCAFVKFIYREDAFAALVGLKQNQEEWTIEWAHNRTKESEAPDDRDRKAIYVGGLDPFRITEQGLREKFGKYGEIESLSLVNPLARNSSEHEEVGENTRSAYAFIRYHTAESAFRAIENENGHEWSGKRLRVQHPDSAESKREKEQKRQQQQQQQPQPPPPLMAHPTGAIPLVASTQSPGVTPTLTTVSANGTASLPVYYIPYPLPYPFGGTSTGSNSTSPISLPLTVTPPTKPTSHSQTGSQPQQTQPTFFLAASAFPPSSPSPVNQKSNNNNNNNTTQTQAPPGTAYYPYPWVYPSTTYPQ